MTKFICTDFWPLGDALCKAAGIDPMYVSRVILDLKVGSAGRIYFETFADDAILDVGLPDGFVIEEA